MFLTFLSGPTHYVFIKWKMFTRLKRIKKNPSVMFIKMVEKQFHLVTHYFFSILYTTQCKNIGQILNEISDDGIRWRVTAIVFFC